MSEQRVKEFANKHGFKLRRVPHSAAEPNGYIKVIAPDGKEHRAVHWPQAMEIMRSRIYK